MIDRPRPKRYNHTVRLCDDPFGGAGCSSRSSAPTGGRDFSFVVKWIYKTSAHGALLGEAASSAICRGGLFIFFKKIEMRFQPFPQDFRFAFLVAPFAGLISMRLRIFQSDLPRVVHAAAASPAVVLGTSGRNPYHHFLLLGLGRGRGGERGGSLWQGLLQVICGSGSPCWS